MVQPLGYVGGLPVRPLWWDEAPPVATRPVLSGRVDADVVIVGAGLTGLWTAYYLKDHEPSMRVAIVEANAVGFGASGRNGGWLSAQLPMSIEAMAKAVSLDGAIAMQREMIATITEVLNRCERHGIVADVGHGGTLTVARSVPQQARLGAEVAALHTNGFTPHDVSWLDMAEAGALVGASRVSGAMFTPHCAAVHPAKLVHGVADVVNGLGVDLFEHSPVTEIGQRFVRTEAGLVTAPVVIRATEAFTCRLLNQRRAIAPVYSLMVATEPLDRDLLGSVGLDNRETFADGRRTIIYGQRTADGRLAFGGRGAPYHFASTMTERHDGNRRIHVRLAETLVELFPQLAGVRFTHRWGGAVGIPRDWWCSVGFDRATGSGWAGGYVGDGLSTTNLAGRTLADLIAGNDSALTRLPWVGHRSPNWEPEPLRWLGINGATVLPTSIDRSETATGKPASRRGRVLDRLTGG